MFGIGAGLGAFVDGKRGREELQIKQNADARAQAADERARLEAEQSRRIRDYQISDLDDKRKLTDTLKAIPTEIDAPVMAATPSYFRSVGRNTDGSRLDDEQAAAFAAYAKQNPEWGAQAAQGLRSQALPNAPQMQFRSQLGADGQVGIQQGNRIQRSASDVNLERARVLSTSGNPDDWIKANQFLVTSLNTQKELVSAKMADINAMPISDTEKAERFAQFMSENEGLPGSFRSVADKDGKNVFQRLDPRTGEVTGEMKPRSFREIMDDTLSGYSVDNYSKIHGIQMNRNADRRAEATEGRQAERWTIEKPGVKADTNVKVNTEKARTETINLEPAKVRSEIDRNTASATASRADASLAPFKQIGLISSAYQATQYGREAGARADAYEDGRLPAGRSGGAGGSNGQKEKAVWELATQLANSGQFGKDPEKAYASLMGRRQARSALEADWAAIEKDAISKGAPIQDVMKDGRVVTPGIGTLKQQWLGTKGFAPEDEVRVLLNGTDPKTNKPFTKQDYAAFDRRYPMTPSSELLSGMKGGDAKPDQPALAVPREAPSTSAAGPQGQRQAMFTNSLDGMRRRIEELATESRDAPEDRRTAISTDMANIAAEMERLREQARNSGISLQ